MDEISKERNIGQCLWLSFDSRPINGKEFCAKRTSYYLGYLNRTGEQE